MLILSSGVTPGAGRRAQAEAARSQAHGLHLEGWEAGERGALNVLNAFLRTQLRRYNKHRQRADRPCVSSISPYLRFGEVQLVYAVDRTKGAVQISPQLVYAVAVAQAAGSATDNLVKKFIGRLIWRDFCYYMMYWFPQVSDCNLRPKFNFLRWEGSEEELEQWKMGCTGYPLVDAGMRQLRHTGYMHNMLRLTTASFLCKELLVDWRHGERWFRARLLDADLAINAVMWQNVSGSGPEPTKKSREGIGCPVAASKAVDPTGDFVRAWLPELAKLPLEYLHQPWEAPPEVLARAGVCLEAWAQPVVTAPALGRYFPPMVELKAAHERVVHSYSSMNRAYVDSTGSKDGGDVAKLRDGRSVRMRTRGLFTAPKEYRSELYEAPQRRRPGSAPTKTGSGGGQDARAPSTRPADIAVSRPRGDVPSSQMSRGDKASGESAATAAPERGTAPAEYAKRSQHDATALAMKNTRSDTSRRSCSRPDLGNAEICRSTHEQPSTQNRVTNGVGDPLKEQELKAHAERANIFLENYAKMQRDIEDGSFVLKKPTRWQMPDGVASTSMTALLRCGMNVIAFDKDPHMVGSAGMRLQTYENEPDGSRETQTNKQVAVVASEAEDAGTDDV
ncbi:hypothetical protein CYMTET_6008 [Cymbomonas tetramitiformis]|uniref:Cryptochrome/DNA photolyase FAD-binding domain-containing protein n=1 Tax=Cymbomonas tetramitiformis TaxID=36881 RepID=A0AAE0LIB8_9CHLO|nr:hypothetical protein CYMTET_6008 [Cymbomonas tetramitiformis]